MPSPYRTVLDTAFVAGAVCMQWKLLKWTLSTRFVENKPAIAAPIRAFFWFAVAVLSVSCVYGILLGWNVAGPIVWLDWLRGFGIAWCIACGGIFAVAFLLRRTPPFNPARREVLTAASSALLAAPVVATGAGIIVGRERFSVVEVEIAYPGLPPDLDGLRILHLSDIHLGPFLPNSDLERVVEMSNETRPHLAVVTGDMITARDDHLPDCLKLLSGLRAEAGILGCFGNHEWKADCLDWAKREGAALGIDFLRAESKTLRFGSADLNIAGTDFQHPDYPYLAGADSLTAPGAFNLLLQHNPDVFPTAAAQGWDLTLAGHTHGGQVTAGVFEQYLNVARVFTPYVYGTYRKDRSAIYVTRGIGTVGVPARIGAPPEIGLIKLCAS